MVPPPKPRAPEAGTVTVAVAKGPRRASIEAVVGAGPRSYGLAATDAACPVAGLSTAAANSVVRKICSGRRRKARTALLWWAGRLNRLSTEGLLGSKAVHCVKVITRLPCVNALLRSSCGSGQDDRAGQAARLVRVQTQRESLGDGHPLSDDQGGHR